MQVVKQPDCKSGLFGVRRFESFSYHHFNIIHLYFIIETINGSLKMKYGYTTQTDTSTETKTVDVKKK